MASAVQREPRARAGALEKTAHAVPAVKGLYGNYRKTSQRRTETEVLHPPAQPLRDLRTASRLFAQVRHLPLVLPRIGAQGRDSRGFEIVLVNQLLVFRFSFSRD